MTHELNKMLPVTISFRYQCPCDGREVLQIQVVCGEREFENEAHFLDIMKAARRDVIIEVNQHIKGAGK